MRISTITLAGVVAVLFVPLLLNAQLEESIPELAVSELTLHLTPPHPRANSLVTIEAENFSVDLNSADFVWSVGGAVRTKGTGMREFSVKTGPAGSVTSVSVTATVPDGRVFAAEVELRPADLDLLWQTEGYAPPFYKGKSLFPYQGTALLAARPRFVDDDGKKIPDRELIYTWKEGGQVIGDASGYGKSLFVIRGTVPIRPKTVSVSAATTDGGVTGTASVTIEPVETRVVFYEDHPLYGIRFDSALDGSFDLQNEEAKLLAVPYYVEGVGSRDVSYSWKQNGEPLSGERGRFVVVRRVSSQGGSTRLALELESAARPFQAAAGRLMVSFPTLFDFIR